MAGDPTLIKDDPVDCEQPGECDPTPVDENCIILYADCEYKGFSTRICGDEPFTDIDYEVKSLKVPKNKTIYLYNMPCFNGQDAQFSKDVACLDKVEFSFLELHGIKLLQENAFMTAAKHVLHAKYRRPNLRKAGVLKSYKRAEWAD